MPNSIQKVPFGYEPPQEDDKGTIVYYDSFEQTTDAELDLAASLVRKRLFTKLILYPLHEQTIRRMTKQPVSPLYKREEKLFSWKQDRNLPYVQMERLEAKRKKYTPIDSALRHLSETYPTPLFLIMSAEMANLFASYTSFEEWIVQIRLILITKPLNMHAKLMQYEHRWEVIE